MSVQQRGNDFVLQLANILKPILMVELFNGQPELMSHKLAVDHVVPLTWQANFVYEVRLTVRINYEVEPDKWAINVFFAKSGYTAAQVLAGANEWSAICQSIAQPMVSSLVRKVNKLSKPVFTRLDTRGPLHGCPKNMRRLWIA